MLTIILNIRLILFPTIKINYLSCLSADCISNPILIFFYDKGLKEYYIKRTQNGKPKMSTINVVQNKILYRMFAVIKRQTPFIENYLQAA